MLDTLASTAPVYLLIAVGFIAVRLDVFTVVELRVLGRFVIWAALPALLFRSVSQSPRAEGSDGLYLLAYAVGSLVCFLAVHVWARHGRGQAQAGAALSGVGAAVSNSGLIGYPIVAQWLGPTAGLALALCMLVENLLIIPLGLGMAERSAAPAPWTQMIARTLLGWARHPMIVAIMLGFVVSLTELPLPTPVDHTMGLLAGAASPTALFVIGGSLRGVQIDGQHQDIAGVALAKLLLHPTCVLLAMLALPAVPPTLRAAGVLFAAMPMLSIYPVLSMKHSLESRSAVILLVATLLAFVTISAWMWGLQQLWHMHPSAV